MLVTGFARGIEYSVAEKCLVEGARVLISGCDAEALAAVCLGGHSSHSRAAATNSIADRIGLVNDVKISVSVRA